MILTPKTSRYPIDLKFYKFYFDSIRTQLRSDLADGTSKLTIDPTDLMEYYIEYIPYDEQIAFRDKNILPYEQLVKQLGEAEVALQNNILQFVNMN